MDYRKFLQELPDQYDYWDQEQIQPKSGDRFWQVRNQVQGMTTVNVMKLLNFAVECMEPEEVYCEIGCFQGATLIGALLDHPHRFAYAVDNFSEFDPYQENLDILTDNLQTFGLGDQVFFCDQDFEEFFFNLREVETEDKIGVYLYDGAHDYRSQLLGLLLARSFLSDQALIIVDDSNARAVQQANWDFIAAHPQCELALNLPTPCNGYPTFWNGIHVLSWDVTRSHSYDWQVFQDNRDRLLIEAIYKLKV